MSAAPPFSKAQDLAGPIDRLIGDQYETIKKVADNLQGFEASLELLVDFYHRYTQFEFMVAELPTTLQTVTDLGTLTNDLKRDLGELGNLTGLGTSATDAIKKLDKAVTDAVTDINTSVQNARDAITDISDFLELIPWSSAVETVASELHLLGARNAAGTAFDLDMSRVKVSPTQTIAQHISAVGAQAKSDAKGYADGLIQSEQFTRATAIDALAQELHLIGAKNADNSAFIIDLDKAYVSPTMSMATRLANLSAGANNYTNAKISQELGVFSDDLEALASAVNLIGAVSPSNNSFVLDMTKVYSGPNETLAQRINNMRASANAYTDSSIQDAQNVWAQDGIAIAEELHLLGVKNASKTAFIIDTSKAYVTPTQSLSQKFSEISSGAEDYVESYIRDSGFALTTDVDAVAQEMHLLGAQNSSKTAFILDMSKVYTSPTQSLASRFSAVESRTQVRPNLLKNSDGAETQTTAPYFPKYFGGDVTYFGRGYDDQIGSFFYAMPNNSGAGKVLFSDGYNIDAGDAISVSLFGDGGEDYGNPTERAYFYINFRNASTGNWDLDSTSVTRMDSRDWNTVRELKNIVVPSGKNGWRFVYSIPNGHAGSSFSRIMVNYGSDCVAYNSQATQNDSVARISQTESTQSSQQEAISALTTRVGVSLADGSALNNNNGFAGYANPTGSPDYWWDWAAGSLSTRVSGRGARYGVRAECPAGANQGHAQTIYLTPGKYVLTADVKCEAGDWSGAGIWLDYAAGASEALDFCAAPDSTGTTTPGGGSSGTRRFTKLINVTRAGSANIYMMNNWDGWSRSRSAKTMVWYECSIRLADAAALSADAKAEEALYALFDEDGALASYKNTVEARFTGADGEVQTAKTEAISAASTATDTAIATYDLITGADTTGGSLKATAKASFGAVTALNGKTQAWLKFTAAADGDVAYASITAGDGSSLLDLRAKRIRLGDSDTPVLEIVGGVAYLTNAKVSGSLVVTGSLQTGALANNAVTNGVTERVSGAISVVGTSGETEIISKSFTTTGGPVRVDIGFNLFPLGGGLTLRVKRNGTLVYQTFLPVNEAQNLQVQDDGASTSTAYVVMPAMIAPCCVYFFTDHPGAGSQTYVVSLEGDASVQDRNLGLLELKK